MLSENELIKQIFYKLQNNEDILKEIDIINKYYNRSFILNYYIGMYYERINNIEFSIKYFNKSINISPYFILPYFHIGNYLLKENKITELKETLNPVFNKSTLDINNGKPQMKYQLEYQLRMANLLLPCIKEIKEARKLYEPFIQKIEQYKNNISLLYIEVFKKCCYHYGVILSNNNYHNEALQYYKKGLSFNNLEINKKNNDINTIDKNLLQMFCICRNYNRKHLLCPIDINKLYQINSNKKSINKKEKIRIGYLSPDFNKNAVGLFVTSLLKYFDTSCFEVFCYYNNDKMDIYTNMFKSFKNIIWYDVKKFSDIELYNIINTNKIDILFDLIGHGVGNRMDVLSMKPAPIIINYLGYPDYTHLSTVDYRLVDNITDPEENDYINYYQGFNYLEKLIKLPKCFICYTLFDNEIMPDIKDTEIIRNNKEIRIGIFNRVAKYDEVIVNIWKEILKSNKNIVLYIKEGFDDKNITYKVLNDIPNNQIKYLPFKNTLEEYLYLFNEVDICLDTYPYSGTTTTCSSLLMGVPVFTLYKKQNPHVSNVSASILKNCGEEDIYICKSLHEYKNNILELCNQNNFSIEDKYNRRDRFLKSMNPEEFMKDYEKMLKDIYKNHL